MAFTVETRQNGDDLEIIMTGALEQGQKLPAVKARLGHRVVIDMARLERANSEGIRLLATWFRSFDPRQQFVFRHVPQRIVDIFNMVAELLPVDHIVESFFIPYLCEKCEHEEAYLARRGKDYVEGVAGRPFKLNLPTSLNCPRCKALMKLEVWESKYFRFLESQESSE